LRAAENRIRQVEAQIREKQLQVETDIQTSRLQVRVAAERREAAKKSVEAARKSLELAAARFESGISTNIEVVSAQESRASADAMERRCLLDLSLGRARLAKAQGDITGLFE
jgi:outer membrane protein TolC